ncbi:Curli production assembly/transport component CsgG [compost metagenome]
MFRRLLAFSLSLATLGALIPDPAFAQMKRSTSIQSFSQAVVPDNRPTLAVLPGGGIYSPHNDILFGKLQTALIQLDRFNMLERSQIQSLVNERDLVRGGYARAQEIGKLLNANKVLVAEMTSDPTAQAIKEDKGYRYQSYARASIRFIDVATGVAYDAFEMSAEASDTTSREMAQMRAMDNLVSSIVQGVRERAKLNALITSRDGRRLILDQGRNKGMKSGLFFQAVGKYDEDQGRLKVVEVNDTHSVAELVRGYYSVKTGATAVEQPYGGMPFGIGYANRSLLTRDGSVEGAFNGLDLHFNQSGYGLSWGLELGHVSHRGGINGFGAFARLEPQLEIVPERFWLYLTLGGGGNLLLASVPSGGASATSGSLNALASVGANLSPFGGLNLFLDGGYMSPWQVGGWTQDLGGDDSKAVTDPMPTPVIGGAFARAGVTWSF